MNRRPRITLGSLCGATRVWLTTRPVAAMLVGLVALGMASIVSSVTRDEAPAADTGDAGLPHTSKVAIETFWEIFHDNAYDAIPRVQTQLHQALRADPSNPTLYALLGATHFWHMSEYTSDPQPDTDVLRRDMPTAVSLFQKALDLDYDGEHLSGYVNDDHLPGYLGITTVHAGQQSNDPRL